MAKSSADIPLRLSCAIEQRPLLRPFSIARGTRTVAEILRVRIAGGGVAGRGASTGVAYRGETAATMLAAVEGQRGVIEAGIDRAGLAALLPPSGARAALDAALWEWEAAAAGTTVAALIGAAPRALASAFTIVVDSAEAMHAQAAAEGWRPLLKVKLGGTPANPTTLAQESARIRAVRAAAPAARLIADANCGWTPDLLASAMSVLVECGYDLIEQPLPVGAEADLLPTPPGLALCLDESFNTLADLVGLPPPVNFVNIKLDKCGGLTEALAIMAAARAANMGVFVGCMVGPTEAVAPAQLLALNADYADLDGPFWLTGEDAKAGLDPAGMMLPIDPAVWGAGEIDA